MDYLKEGIGLRAMAQRDPLVEYQREGFQLFQAMTVAIKEESAGFLYNLEIQVDEHAVAEAPADEAPAREATAVKVAATSAPGLVAKTLDAPARRSPLQYSAPSVDGDSSGAVTSSAVKQAVSIADDGKTFPGTPRNGQCPCGSGKKYKVCHGKNEVA